MPRPEIPQEVLDQWEAEVTAAEQNMPSELTLAYANPQVRAKLHEISVAVNLSAMAGPVISLSRLFKSLGTFHGSFAVWVSGDTGQEKALAFVAPQNGPRVPSAPAVLLARKLLAEGIPAFGAFPCIGFVSLAEFADYLAPFGIFVVRGENGVWSSP